MRYGDENRRDLRISRASGHHFVPPTAHVAVVAEAAQIMHARGSSDQAGSDGELRNGCLLIDILL